MPRLLDRAPFRARVVGEEQVQSPLSSRPCAFAVVELWAGDTPGDALRRVARMVIGDVVQLASDDGLRVDVVVRRATLAFAGEPPALEVASRRPLPPEIVALLTTTRARVTEGLSVGEHVVRAGASVLVTPPTAGEPWILADIRETAEV